MADSHLRITSWRASAARSSATTTCVREGTPDACSIPPFEGLLQAEGFNALDTASDVIGSYQGQVAATRRGWAAAHPEIIIGFARTFLDALAWLYDPDNLEEACAIFRANVPDATDAAARTAHGVPLQSPQWISGRWTRRHAALANVIALRAQFGMPRVLLGPPLDYYDGRYVEEALRAAR